ncbi:hypothetical protein [Enterovirga sp. CN4-39]|uniref:hypothetical protein n=1 Tax=Enterovirga sp. CN4-39 TaxID=3400910 RepID=UPI003C09FDC9
MEDAADTFLPDYRFRCTPTTGRFDSVTNAHGLYSTEQFVLRLSPVVHRILASHEPGIQTNGALGFEGAKAMSTLLHETIHWWQHIGTTHGLIFSLNYPVRSHATHFHLKELVTRDGFKKSVVQQAAHLGRSGPTGYGTTSGLANTIVNNHFDLMTFRAYSHGPDATKYFAENALFETVGHAFHMTYAHTVNQLASTVDKDYATFDHPRDWAVGFHELTERRVDGYYYGSPVGLWPFGTREIFEGQACFAQIQFLSHACEHRLSIDDYRSLGLLHGVYETAFREFLKLTEAAPPDRPDDPRIGLFLLICDLALNPGVGFPFELGNNHEHFMLHVTPAARFSRYCRVVALKHPELLSAVRDYSRDEYVTVSETLCHVLGDRSPMEIAERCSNWFAGPFAGLRGEYERYVFQPENFVLRHLLAHFLAFQEDKVTCPEFFCWPGAWLAGDNLGQSQVEMFDKHGALFTDKEEGETIYPRIQKWRDEKNVYDTFNDFYGHNVLFELADQWITKPGPFVFDLDWLSSSGSETEVRAFIRRQFKAAYGLDIESVTLL